MQTLEAQGFVDVADDDFDVRLGMPCRQKGLPDVMLESGITHV
jgi:hypothetical protein